MSLESCLPIDTYPGGKGTHATAITDKRNSQISRTHSTQISVYSLNDWFEACM